MDALPEARYTVAVLTVGVLISGSGTNLQAILDGVAEGSLPVRIGVVISNRAGVRGLERAETAGVPTRVMDHRGHARREDYDAALIDALRTAGVGLVVLAGFDRLVTPVLLQAFPQRVINIHPALLPSFPGLDTHARALAAGVKLHGCTVHFVTAEVDHGPIVIQAALPVRAGESEAALAARVLALEHVVYPRAVRWFLEGRLVLQNGAVSVKGNDAQLVLSPD